MNLSGDASSMAEARKKKTANPRHAARLLRAGRLIALARERAGMTQRQLEEMSGTGHGVISRLEKGERPELTAGVFLDVCIALGLDPYAVWNDLPGADRPVHRPASSPDLSTPAPPDSAERPSRPARGLR